MRWICFVRRRPSAHWRSVASLRLPFRAAGIVLGKFGLVEQIEEFVIGCPSIPMEREKPLERFVLPAGSDRSSSVVHPLPCGRSGISPGGFADRRAIERRRTRRWIRRRQPRYGWREHRSHQANSSFDSFMFNDGRLGDAAYIGTRPLPYPSR